MTDTVRSDLTRRRLLQRTAIGTGAATALALAPRPLTALLGGRNPEPIPLIQDDRIKGLVQRALDAAKSAGAPYAEARLTYTKRRDFYSALWFVRNENESLHFSVRALIDGYWGFSASPVWTPEEAVRLGREAVRQAKANTLGKVREIPLPARTTIPNGHWETPVELDPFQIDPIDISDYLGFVEEQVRLELAPYKKYGFIDNNRGGADAGFGCWQQSRAFGATDGTYCTQRITRSKAEASLVDKTVNVMGLTGNLMTPTGAGWELFRNESRIIETIMESVATFREMSRIPVKPVDVGRYTAVFDAGSVAKLLSLSVGEATHVDRAFGYLANDVGTSYLNDPEAMLGTFALGHSSLTVTANRNEPGGLATVRWDEEGIEPTPFTLVDRGVVTDFHTSREGAGLLKSRYEQLGRSFRSNGSAWAETANDSVGIGMANLVMQPANTTASYQDLEQSIDKGLSFVGLLPSMDFQLTSGFATYIPQCFEIRNGKRVARVFGGGVMFRTLELWKGLIGIGDRGSQQRYGLDRHFDFLLRLRGFGSSHTVTAVPIVVKDLAIIDPQRR